MAESLDSLLSQREQARETEKNLTFKIISEAEKYVLSAIYLASKVNSEQFVPKPIIESTIKNIYDKRIESYDITKALTNLLNNGTVRESRNRDPKPNDYGIATGEFGKVPVLEYISAAEAEKIAKGDNLPF